MKIYRRTSFRLVLLMVLSATLTSLNAEKSSLSRYETVHNSNAAILNRLGLVPLRIPDGHHKKRLAGPEPSDTMDMALTSQTRLHQPYSRRHGHRDSHVYVVKLPPSQPYYTLTKPHKGQPNKIATKDNDKDSTGKKTIVDNSTPQVGFHSNGKPGKIYHWNLPLVKKISVKKRLRTQMKMEQMRKRLENEMNDETRKNFNHQLTHKTDVTLYDKKKHPSTILASKKSTTIEETNDKRYQHSTSVNSLNNREKTVKHTRNNDKRLNYPRLPEKQRKSDRPEDNYNDKSPRDDTSKNKMYRLEDSNLYRLDSRYNEGHNNNDRIAAVWSLSNDLHGSVNSPNSLRPKKHRKKSAMSYYAPINARNNKIVPSAETNIQKNFPGNGKPKAFYVMEKSRQPIYYHPLLP